MADNHWRMQLNNFLQGNGGTRMLSWDVFPSGPSHQVVWTAVTYIRGVQYAKSISSRQNVAMEEAARLTLDTLYSDRMRGY